VEKGVDGEGASGDAVIFILVVHPSIGDSVEHFCGSMRMRTMANIPFVLNNPVCKLLPDILDSSMLDLKLHA
jgi:hypothetical protein